MTNTLTVSAAQGLPYVDFTREFDAPLAKVWKAYTEPDLIAQWMGPRQYKNEDVTFEARTGGSWTFTNVADDGGRHGFRGVLHAVEDRKSITQTFEYAGWPGKVSLERLDFTDLGDGRTRLTGHAVYQSLEDRDGMVSAGMEHGMVEGYDRLEELLATL